MPNLVRPFPGGYRRENICVPFIYKVRHSVYNKTAHRTEHKANRLQNFYIAIDFKGE